MAVRLYIKAPDSVLEQMAKVPAGTAKEMASKHQLYSLFRSHCPPYDMVEKVFIVEPEFKEFFEKTSDEDWQFVLYRYIEEKYPSIAEFDSFITFGFGRVIEEMIELIYQWKLENGPGEVYAGGTKDKEQMKHLLRLAQDKDGSILPIERCLDQIEQVYWV